MATRFITDDQGNRQGVLLTIEEYEELVEAREELADIAAHNEAVEAIRNGEKTIPWEDVRDKIGSEYDTSERS